MKMRNENQVGFNQNYQPPKKMTTSKKTNALGKRKWWYKKKKFKNIPSMYPHLLPDTGEQQKTLTETKIVEIERIPRYARLLRSFKGSSRTKRWSEKPGSNRRPQPWQGCALPTELFSLSDLVIKRTFPDAVNAIIWCYPLPHQCYRGNAWSLHNSWDGFRLAAQFLSAKIERAFSCNHRIQQNDHI